MENSDISQYMNLSHNEILEKFPEISLIKEYSNLIIDFYTGRISEFVFIESLQKHGIAPVTVNTLILSLKQQQHINSNSN